MSDVKNIFLVGKLKNGIRIILLNNRTISREEAINLCSHIISNLDIKALEIVLGIAEIGIEQLDKYNECHPECLHLYGIDNEGTYHPPCKTAYEKWIVPKKSGIPGGMTKL